MALLSGRCSWRMLWWRQFRFSLGFLPLCWFCRGQCDAFPGPFAWLYWPHKHVTFFSDRHKMGLSHLVQQPIDNLWAHCLETKSLECPQAKHQAIDKLGRPLYTHPAWMNSAWFILSASRGANAQKIKTSSCVPPRDPRWQKCPLLPCCIKTH